MKYLGAAQVAKVRRKEGQRLLLHFCGWPSAADGWYQALIIMIRTKAVTEIPLRFYRFRLRFLPMIETGPGTLGVGGGHGDHARHL